MVFEHRVPGIVCWLLLLPGLGAAQAEPDSTRRMRTEGALASGGAVHALTAPLRWNGAQVRTAAGVVVGVAALSALDGAGRTFMRNNQSARINDVANQIERFGTVENYVVLGGLYAAGIVLGDDKARDVAIEGIASSVVAAALITPTLQFVIGRSRPRRNDGVHSFDAFSGNISLPSGHTTQAFAVASVIAAEYNHLAVQIAAYGLAGSVALSRMYHDAHFLSDVTAAAIIGTVVGRSVVSYGRTRRDRPRVDVEASADGAYGIRVSVPIH